MVDHDTFFRFTLHACTWQGGQREPGNLVLRYAPIKTLPSYSFSRIIEEL